MDAILRAQQVFTTTGKSRSSVYSDIGKGLFPRPVSLGERAVGWRASDIEAWISSRVTVEQPAELNPQKRRKAARVAASSAGDAK
jgi:prophage regulatory protein